MKEDPKISPSQNPQSIGNPLPHTAGRESPPDAPNVPDETIRLLAEGRVEIALQYLKHRLLNEPVEYSWNTELTPSASARLRYLDPAYRHRLIATVQQRLPNLRPVFAKIGRQLLDGHPVNPRRPFIASYLPECLTQILPFEHLSIVSPQTTGLWFPAIAAQSSALLSSGFRASPALPVAKASSSWIGCRSECVGNFVFKAIQ